jgi:hypothetical protein
MHRGDKNRPRLNGNTSPGSTLRVLELVYSSDLPIFARKQVNVSVSTKHHAYNRAEQSHEAVRVRARGIRPFKPTMQAQ